MLPQVFFINFTSIAVANKQLTRAYFDKNFHMKSTKPKRLSDKEMHELLKRVKAKSDKMPEEEGSFSVEVICSAKDINPRQKSSK